MKPPEELKRAISIRQPYVEQILTGEKPFEYRSRPTNIRERVYLYAGKQLADTGTTDVLGARLPRGMILGSVEIVSCVEDEDGGYAYGLAAPRRYEAGIVPGGQPQPAFWYPRFA